ncbi:TlpA family protein disulfide reductase [Microlunatus flavus]|uniref:Thiol-disulfide isomerase or thioredoxin n=1 Tax=Microlunatus flavus TaxID=1036181 RepID=A0A1H8ZQ61_9ACTN|nr:TlpA disulfide reductase family protein [Microlunatus flavus]SEP65808.1 Thiol-disulfide isomerase or thioredoxin [Microlunatus flavus]
MTAPRRLLAVGLLVALALTGCTETPSVVRDPSAAATVDGGTEQVPTGDAAPNVDLAAAKKAAGIPDCPDTSGAPVRGGLPDVTLECLGGGRPVRLSDLRGPMLVNVWGSWCGPCRAEAPFLAEAGRSSTVKVLGIDYPDVPEAAVDFAGSAGWTYPQLYDADLVVRGRLQVLGLPQTFFVRADGTVAGRHAGPFLSRQELDDASRQYLGVTP